MAPTGVLDAAAVARTCDWVVVVVVVVVVVEVLVLVDVDVLVEVDVCVVVGMSVQTPAWQLAGPSLNEQLAPSCSKLPEKHISLKQIPVWKHCEKKQGHPLVVAVQVETTDVSGVVEVVVVRVVVVLVDVTSGRQVPRWQYPAAPKYRQTVPFTRAGPEKHWPCWQMPWALHWPAKQNVLSGCATHDVAVLVVVVDVDVLVLVRVLVDVDVLVLVVVYAPVTVTLIVAVRLLFRLSKYGKSPGTTNLKEYVQVGWSVPESNSGERRPPFCAVLVTVCGAESKLRRQTTVSPVLTLVSVPLVANPHSTSTTLGPVPVVVVDVEVDVAVVVVVVVVGVVVVGATHTPAMQAPPPWHDRPSGTLAPKKHVETKQTPVL